MGYPTPLRPQDSAITTVMNPSYLVAQRGRISAALQEAGCSTTGTVSIYLPPTTVEILYEYSYGPPRVEIFQVPAQMKYVRRGTCNPYC